MMIEIQNYYEHESSNATSQGWLLIISDNGSLNVPIYRLPQFYSLWTLLLLMQLK